MTVNHRHDTAAIVIRDIESFDEMRAVGELQKEVWDFADLDVVPRTIFVASRSGAVLVGAAMARRWSAVPALKMDRCASFAHTCGQT